MPRVSEHNLGDGLCAPWDRGGRGEGEQHRDVIGELPRVQVDRATQECGRGRDTHEEPLRTANEAAIEQPTSARCRTEVSGVLLCKFSKLTKEPRPERKVRWVRGES